MNHYFSSALSRIKLEGRYRSFTELRSSTHNGLRPYSVTDNKYISLWCSNDYLSMSKNPVVVKALADSACQLGAGSGGTRNISGSSNAICKVEREISNIHSKESALVFTSGYIANQSTLSTLSKIIPNCVIFSDQNNHASIIHGIKESNLEKVIFHHNDMRDLEKKLRQYSFQTPKIIVFEAVYSMSGAVADIFSICELAKKYNALTYVDEVHSVGIYGKNGSGMCEELGCQDKVDIIQGTFAKAYGVMGGYIASRNIITDSIRCYSSGFIFTTSLPPAVAEAILSSILYLKDSNIERIKLKNNVALLKKKLRHKKITVLENNTHIIPVMINDVQLCHNVYVDLLQKHSIYIQGINFPTVPRGQERLRITVNAMHTEKMIENLVESLHEVLHRYKIISH